MFCGRATVSTDVGAVVEVIGGTGLVVPPRNPQALAEACVALLRDPERRERLGAAARARALELFTVEQNITAFHGIYLEIVSRTPVRRVVLDDTGEPLPVRRPRRGPCSRPLDRAQHPRRGPRRPRLGRGDPRSARHLPSPPRKERPDERPGDSTAPAPGQPGGMGRASRRSGRPRRPPRRRRRRAEGAGRPAPTADEDTGDGLGGADAHAPSPTAMPGTLPVPSGAPSDRRRPRDARVPHADSEGADPAPVGSRPPRPEVSTGRKPAPRPHPPFPPTR